MNDTLTRAYELIEAEQMSQARDILESFLARERNNADAWWLYAHAVANIDEAQTALANVKRIDPNYPGVDALIEQMNDRLAQMGEGSQIQEFTESPVEIEDEDFEPDFDDLDLPEDDFDDLDFDEDDDPEPEIVERAPWMRYLMYGLILVLLLIAAFILLFGRDVGDDSVDVTPTGVASMPTPEETASPLPFTAASVTLIEALADEFELASDELEMQQTQFGETSFVVICSDAAEFRDVLTDAMMTIGESNATISTIAVGVRIINCATDEPLNTIVVETVAIQQFVAGSLTENQFRGQWEAARFR